VWSIEIQPTFRRNMSPPSSGSKNKPSNKPARSRFASRACFMLVSCVAYSSTLSMEETYSPKGRLAFKGLHNVISQKIELFITTDARTSVPNAVGLINALPGNSSVNTVQHATIDETVFSVSSAPSRGGTTGLRNPFLSKGSVNTLPHKR
jgi:hypothetical protein